jgi:hypothetical protein
MQQGGLRMRSGGIRTALALLLLVAAAALLVPSTPSAQRVTWAELIAPLAVGLPVTRGYVLSPPRRGEGHGVV